ncbi:MAG: dihydropteroate synthase [Burkholderiales bacterium]|nr:dihydropteroate synthase [Burkholderiales bacterium]
MGIVNVTPDSFSDGGNYYNSEAALSHALALSDDGADIIDIGGESSRPGASPVSEDEELNRVMPLVEALVRRGILVSVDTTKPAIMREAGKAGAAMINDISALQHEGALDAVAATGAVVCLMHMKGNPDTMQKAPYYDDVVSEVEDFLTARAKACEDFGIARDHIVIDPGFGFGKTTEHNLDLMRALPKLRDLPYPLLVGWSRKSTLGEIAGGRNVADRLPASLAAALAATNAGANVLRVHDVKETLDALKVWRAMNR